MTVERLTAAEKRELLAIARRTLDGRIGTGETPPLDPVQGRLGNLTLGAFVTLKTGGELRGCIGNFGTRESLPANVSRMTVAAALEDPRFDAVHRTELGSIEIEISVLYPLVRVAELDEIVVGRDGLYIVSGMNHGVLLPQVAVEYGWNREQFLSHTCVKAALPPDAWRRGSLEIYRFEADVFGEAERGMTAAGRR